MTEKSSEQQLQQRIAELESQLSRSNYLIEVGQKVGACSNVDTSLEYLLEVLVSETGADRGSIFLNDQHTGELFSRVMVGNYRREIRELAGAGIVYRPVVWTSNGRPHPAV